MSRGIIDIDGVDTDRDGIVDVTERVEVYDKGKVFSCNCGQDIGIGMNRQSVICATCGNMCVDMDYEKRESPDRDKDQTSITNW